MKQFYISSMFILLTCSLHGQDKKEDKKETKKMPTLEAVYDFEKQIYTTDELKPVHKQPVILKIININKIANNVEIISSDVKINDDFLDAKEEQVKSIIEDTQPVEEVKPSLVNVDLDVNVPQEFRETGDAKINETIKRLRKKILEKNNEIIGQNNEVAKKNTDVETLNKQKLELKTKLDNDLIGLDDDDPQKKQFNDAYLQKSKEIDDNIKKLKSEIEDNKTKIESTKKIVAKDEIELTSISDDVNKFENHMVKLTQIYNEYVRNLKDINRINSAYNSYIDYIINPNLTYDQYTNDAKVICAILDDEKRKEYYSEINDFDEQYSKFMEHYNLILNDGVFYKIAGEDESYSKLVKAKFDLMKKDVEAIYKKVNITELRKKLNNAEIINNVLSQKKSYIVVSNPIQPLEDYLEFKVKIKQSRDLGSSILKNVDKDFTYMEYVRKGVRWDVSVGTVFDFGIKDQEFEVKDLGNSEYEIIENNTSSYTPTVAGLLHTSFRTNSMFAFGFSLGVSVNVTDLNFNSFFPGVSLLIGKREKIVFTAGPAFKKVKQIKSIYENDRILSQPIQVEDITSDQFKIGWFFGISYNLTNKQKSKIKTLK